MALYFTNSLNNRYKTRTNELKILNGIKNKGADFKTWGAKHIQTTLCANINNPRTA